MLLTAKEKEIITSSFAQLVKDNISISKYFYKNLFDMAPLIRPMFTTDHQVLEQHFDELIGTAVDKVDNFELLSPVLFDLGKKHQEYEAVQPVHFDVVKAAFILSLQYALKDKCNEMVKEAWEKYIDNISHVMIKGLLTTD